jgi:hypothetical protein
MFSKLNLYRDAINILLIRKKQIVLNLKLFIFVSIHNRQFVSNKK